MQPDQTMVVIYDQNFIFTLFSLLFLLIFSLFQFPSVVSAADDFFGIFPEDYYDPEDYGEKSTTVHEQLDVNNTIDQDNLITTEDKSNNVTSTLPEDSKDFNFIAAGDWNCNKETQRTIKKITDEVYCILVISTETTAAYRRCYQCQYGASDPRGFPVRSGKKQTHRSGHRPGDRDEGPARYRSQGQREGLYPREDPDGFIEEYRRPATDL